MNKKHKLFIIETISCICLLIVTTMTVSSYFILSQKPDVQIDFSNKNYYVTTKMQTDGFVPSLTLPEKENIDPVNDLVDTFIEDNKDITAFYTNTFQLQEEYINNKIKELNYDKVVFNKDNALHLENEYASYDEMLFHYIISLTSTNPELFSNIINITYDSKEYIIGLIDYFGIYFPNVDTNIAKAIANIESGYTVRSMLDKNNVFGGMSSGYLISYKSIEFGIYSYMKLLNDGYFSQGLTTVATIGYKYNPVIENGVKMASPSWVTKVNNNLHLFSESTVSNINELLELKN